MESRRNIESFFTPAGVVVIGASREPTKLGYGVARNLTGGTYGGAVHFVNPAGGELFGRTLHASVAKVPDPVELAVLVIPASEVPGAIRECGERGIRAVVVISGGFRESGAAGARLEEECAAVARTFGMSMLGPNCIGTIDTRAGLDTTFLQPPGPPPGEVAFISHSGATCAAVIDWARGRGFGFSRVVSLGNEAGLSVTDVLEAVAADPATGVVALYLEGLADGRRFVDTAARIRKPIVALKVGRSEGGRRAAASHTGALAGRDVAYSAAFRRAGIIRAGTSEELLDWARAMAWAPLPGGRRVAVLTNAGGPGVTAADAIEAAGLQLTVLQPSTRRALGGFLPAAAGLDNPVDMLASASPSAFAEGVRVLLADPGVDGLLVVFPPPPMFPAEEVAKAVVTAASGAAKPVLAAVMGEESVDRATQVFREARIPEYRFPERAASVLAVLARRAEAASPAAPVRAPETDRGRAEAILAACPPGWMGTETAGALVAAYGIPVPPAGTAAGPAEAAAVADEIGYPVAVKVESADIVHKSDGGGVRLDLADAGEVRSAVRSVLSSSRAAHPAARLAGVLVQSMAGSGRDVIAGCVRDPQFGPLLMFGSGGAAVEELADVEFALAPPTRGDLEYLMTRTRAGRLLLGHRGSAASDRAAVERVLVGLSQLLADHPAILELEVNPLRVFRRGAAALDVRVRIEHSA